MPQERDELVRIRDENRSLRRRLFEVESRLRRYEGVGLGAALLVIAYLFGWMVGIV